MSQPKVSPADRKSPGLSPDEKLPALTDMSGKNGDGSPRKRHKKQRKATSRSQSPSTSSKLPVVPESSRDSKLVVADEGAKEPAGEGSTVAKGAEAKATVAATKGDGGQPTVTKGDGSQANEDGPKVSRVTADEKLPALTYVRGMNSDGSPRKRHQKQRKPKGRSQSPSTSSRLPVVPESSRESKLAVADKGANESVGEGQRSTATKEAEAKATVAETKGDGGPAYSAER
ncbi:hypothetical protein MTO96_031617 [Rhipicephalus appendiculatus]